MNNNMTMNTRNFLAAVATAFGLGAATGADSQDKSDMSLSA